MNSAALTVITLMNSNSAALTVAVDQRVLVPALLVRTHATPAYHPHHVNPHIDQALFWQGAANTCKYIQRSSIARC